MATEVYLTGLTDDEHEAIRLTADLWNLVVGKVILPGPTAAQDQAEFCAKIHDIQRTIMAQAAAREHPDLYRLLGGSIEPETRTP